MTIDLTQHPAQGEPAPRSRPTVITLSHQSPMPPAAGNEYRLLDLLRCLGGFGYRPLAIVCPLEEHEATGALPQLLASDLEFVLIHRDGRVHARLNDLPLNGAQLEKEANDQAWEQQREAVVGAGLRRLESHYSHPVMRAVLAALVPQISDLRAIIANYVYSGGLLSFAPEGCWRILDTIDVFSRQLLAEPDAATGRTTTLTEPEERTLLAAADVVVAIQPVEAVVLADLAPTARVISCGVSFPQTHVPIEPAARKRVGIIGSGNRMNTTGLHGFLRTVWPTVLREEPDAELLVAGQLSDHVPAWAPQVRRLGRVDQTVDLYRQAATIVNPASQGTGLKIKTIEALAHDRPVVCWPAGAEGLEHRGLTQLVAERTAPALAASLVTMLRRQEDLATEEELFPPADIYRDLLDVLRTRRPA